MKKESRYEVDDDDCEDTTTKELEECPSCKNNTFHFWYGDYELFVECTKCKYDWSACSG